MVCDVLDVACQINVAISPIVNILTWFYDLILGTVLGIIYLFTEIIGMGEAFLNLGVAIVSFLTDIFDVILIDAWSSLILSGVTLVIAFRIYRLVKG